MILKPDGTITYESPAVERVLGYSPRDRIGKSAFAAGRRRRTLSVLRQAADRCGPLA